MCKLCNKFCHAGIKPSAIMVMLNYYDYSQLPKAVIKIVWMNRWGDFDPFVYEYANN